jgi:hypothetical protein
MEKPLEVLSIASSEHYSFPLRFDFVSDMKMRCIHYRGGSKETLRR